MRTPRRFWITAPLAAAGLLHRSPSAYAAQPHWPGVLVLATASPGGTYHAYGAGLARILARALATPVVPRGTEGPSENIRLIESGAAHLGFVTMGAALQAWSGSGAWTEGRRFQALRALFPMYDTPFHFVVRRDGGIGSVAELSGRRIGVGPEAGTAADYMPKLLASLGIEAQLGHGNWDELAARLAVGELDSLAVAAGAPFPAISELEARRAIRYLPLSRSQIVAMRLVAPELTPSVIPAGTYPSLARGYETIGLFNFAVTRRDLPDDLAHRIVRAAFDHNAELVEAHPAAAATVPENFVHNTVLPYHAGALRYLGNRAVRGVMSAD